MTWWRSPQWLDRAHKTVRRYFLVSSILMSETAGFFGFFKSLSTQHKSLLLSCYAVMFSQVCFPKRLLLTNFLIVPLLIPLLYDLAVLSHVFPFTIFSSTRGKNRSFRITGLYSSDHHRATNWTRRERNNSNKAQQQSAATKRSNSINNITTPTQQHTRHT